jgi:transketolase
VLDCDLVGSVKANGFASVRPDQFFQVGIQEHNAATIAGVLSIEGIITYFCDFGVFGVCETYNQHRLNDINRTGLKLVCTHIGLDVGEDGKTHQCIDYIGLIRNLFGYKIIIPADPNQTDRATRFITETHGNFLLGMGRSNTPVILDTDGKPFYGEGYTFRYGAVDVIRPGDDAAIITCGSMVHRALSARDMLSRKGIQARILNAASPCKLDIKVIAEAAETGLIITYEDHAVQSGLGTIVADTLLANGLAPALRKMGITRYGLSGKPDDIYAAAGLSPEALADTVAHAVSGKKIRSSSLSLESTA